jgi:uncharacterized protein (PEP-CTERM system associated)
MAMATATATATAIVNRKAARFRSTFERGAAWPKRAVFLSAVAVISPSLHAQYTDVAETAAPAAPQRALEIHPTLSLEQTYTDNVRLRPPGSEQGDWVTQIRPGVHVLGNGARVRFSAIYSANLLYRLNEKTRDIQHLLDAKGNAELVEKFFFVDASANISQQDISLLGPQAVSDVNVTGNRTNVRTLRISPYLRQNFGSLAQAELRYTYGLVDSSAATSFGDSTSDRIDATLASGPAYKLFTWNLAYNKQHIDYDRARDVDTERITASGRRLITPTLGVRATVGYENNNFISAGPEPKGSFWSVGPEWKPTPRTLIAATTGRRFFGSTQTVEARHRTRLSTWSLEYSEDVTTQAQQAIAPTTVSTASLLDSLLVSRIPDPILREQAVQAFIAQTGLPPTALVPLNFFTTAPFFVKRLRATFGIQGVRNTILANLFRESREATDTGVAGAGDFGSSRDIKQTGGNLTWTRHMTANVTSNVSIGYTRNGFPSLGREDEIKYLRLSLRRQFHTRTFGSLTYRRLDSDSSQAGAGYTENAVTATLTMRF